MSLEQAITDHAGALRELAAAIRATIGAPAVALAPTGALTAELDAATDKVIADAKKPAATASSPNGAKPRTTVPKENAPAKEPEAAAGPSYEDVKAKVLALSKEKGRDALVALLSRHGVTKAPDLNETQYAKVIEDADAILAGTYDPEAAELA